MHIRDLRRIRPMLDFKTASTIATTIVHSKLDYCNSIFLNLESTQLKRLQLIQNSLARAVTRTPKHHHINPQITPLVKNPRANSLQSLITNLQLSTILPAQISSRPLHYPVNPLYQIFLHSHSLSRPPVTRLTTHLKFSNRAISNTATRLWNDLPPEFRTFSVPQPSSPITHHHPHQAPLSITAKAFHSKLKSLLFKNSYPDSTDPVPLNSRPKRHPP